jgi:hypothetical protein
MIGVFRCRGGLSNTAFIHSPLLPESLRGQSYDYTVHITGQQMVVQ